MRARSVLAVFVVSSLVVFGNVVPAAPAAATPAPAVATSAAVPPSQPVGATNGTMVVDPNGGAAYSIPIAVPPGTAGKAPNLVLSYNKATGEGLAGTGFSLGGLSVVTRCGRTIALDGVRGSVNYDGNDRFCLDGQRLVAISGSYGADGTEYRTERDTFARVYSRGVQDGGPRSFTVTSRDGGVTEYGFTDDSRIEASGKSVVRLWAMNKSQDAAGNYFTVSYTEDNFEGEYVPDRIDYTGNGAAGLAPYNSVRFSYERNWTNLKRYEGGSVIGVTRHLTSIQTYADDTMAREYRLSYDATGTVADPSASNAGLEAWTSMTPGRVVDDGSTSMLGDVNGDGKADLVNVTGSTGAQPGRVHVGLSSGSSFAQWTWMSTGRMVDDGSASMLGDVNGDGKADLVNVTGSTSTVPGRAYVGLSNGSSFAQWTWMSTGRMADDGSASMLGDVNGDGKADLVNVTGSTGTVPGRAHVGLSNGTSFAHWTWMSTGRTVDDGSTSMLGDVNGDGKADLVNVTNPSGYQPTSRVRIGLTDGTSFAGWTWTDPHLESNYASRKFLGDVNGDGKADFLSIADVGSWTPHRSFVGISKGNAFEYRTWDAGAPPSSPSQSLVADVSGDGRVDLVNVGRRRGTDPPGSVRVALSKNFVRYPVFTTAAHLTAVQECGSDGGCLPATRFTYQTPVTGFTAGSPAGSYGADMTRSAGGSFWGDVNGDDRSDFVYLQNGTSSWHVMLGNGTTLGEDTVWGTSTQGIKWDTGDYPRLQDVNADGRADIVYYQAGTGAIWRVLLSTGSSFAPDAVWAMTTRGIDGYGGVHAFFLVDANGDAKTDIVYLEGGTLTWRAALSSAGSNTLGPDWVFGTQASGTAAPGSYAAHYWGDVNGDTKADLIYMKTGTQSWRVSLSTGTGLGPDTEWGSPSSDIKWDACDPRLTDINADGKSDMAYCSRQADGVHLRFLVSTGASFRDTLPSAVIADAIARDGRPQLEITDVDGDGRPDAVYLMDGTTTWRAMVSSEAPPGRLEGIKTFRNQSGFTIPTGAYHAHYWTDVDGDGKSDLANVNAKDGTTTFWFDRASPTGADHLSTVTNGLGSTIKLTYRPLTDPGTYTRGSGAVYPYVDVQNGTQVVSRVTYDDGLGGQYGVGYRYTGGRTHLTGPGWVGFRQVQSTDERTDIVSTTTYSQDYESRLNGLVTLVEAKRGSVVVKRTTTGWTGVDLGDGRRFARTDWTKESTVDLDGSPKSCVKTDNAYISFDEEGNYGEYGLPSTVITRTGTDCGLAGAFVTTTLNSYAHDTARNILGRLTRTQITHQAPGRPDITRTTMMTYTAVGQLESETVEPDSETLWSTTSYAYNAFGNRTGSTVSGPDITDRTAGTSFDTRGRYPVGETNALGHTSAVTVDPRWGTPLAKTDVNGLTLAYEYDGLGRQTKETRPDNSATTTTYAACDSCARLGNGVDPVYVVTNQATGGSLTREYYDSLNRLVRSEGQGLNGAAIYQDRWYDTQGRIRRHSQPYFAGSGAPLWTSYAYDDMGRTTAETDPAGKLTATAYAGGVTTETISGSGVVTRSRTTVRNALGHELSVTDSLYPTRPTSCAYDATGKLIRLTDPSGNQTTATYDVRGRKTRMTDPDTGSWSYDYNSVGELVSQTDAKGQAMTVTYDALGRVTTRTTGEGTSTWTYDTAVKGVGQLARVSAPGGVVETYGYDPLGRPNGTTTTIDGQNYTVSTDYDSAGRPKTLTYPTGFAIRNVYGPTGQLVEVRNNQTDALYWKANEADARGHLTSETMGNGLVVRKTYDQATGTLSGIRTTDSGRGATLQDLTYTYDVLGNLTSRADNTQDISEDFLYDTLNRLLAVIGPSSRTYRYDRIGNITAKSDVGTYTYPTSGPNAARPHAVTQVKGTVNASYTYDANGNMTSGAGRDITYTSFNKPSQITIGDAITSFAYDANYNRVKKATPASTTVYIRQMYERVTTKDLVEHRHYINGVAVYTSRSNGTDDTVYLLKDHLGSTDAITDQTGSLVQKLSYDTTGKPRNSDWTDASDPITVQTTRGFTGHDSDPEAGLINMNAREYDPVLGRFLQPDTIVETSYGQGLNRYTYASNSPLTYVDPTGNFSLKKLVRAIVVVVVSAWCPVCGAVLQAGLVKHDGGTWSQALKAGVSSWLGGQIGGMYTNGTFGTPGTVGAYAGRAVAQGVVSGLRSESLGGSFGTGFKRGFLDSVGGSIIDATFGDPKYDSSLKPADKDAVYKPDVNEMKSNPTYAAKVTEICKTRDVCDWNAANAGSAVTTLNADLVGQPVPTGANVGWFSEAGPLKYAAKYIPGVQARSNLHDMHMGVVERTLDSSRVYNFVGRIYEYDLALGRRN